MVHRARAWSAEGARGRQHQAAADLIDELEGKASARRPPARRPPVGRPVGRRGDGLARAAGDLAPAEGLRRVEHRVAGPLLAAVAEGAGGDEVLPAVGQHRPERLRPQVVEVGHLIHLAVGAAAAERARVFEGVGQRAQVVGPPALGPLHHRRVVEVEHTERARPQRLLLGGGQRARLQVMHAQTPATVCTARSRCSSARSASVRSRSRPATRSAR